MSILQAIRTFFFYLLLGTSSLLWCTLSFFIAPFLPFRARYRFINVYWCRCARNLRNSTWSDQGTPAGIRHGSRASAVAHAARRNANFAHGRCGKRLEQWPLNDN